MGPSAHYFHSHTLHSQAWRLSNKIGNYLLFDCFNRYIYQVNFGQGKCPFDDHTFNDRLSQSIFDNLYEQWSATNGAIT